MARIFGLGTSSNNQSNINYIKSEGNITISISIISSIRASVTAAVSVVPAVTAANTMAKQSLAEESLIRESFYT